MSRAFVREPDGDEIVDALPELPQQPIPNYVTPQGMAALRAWCQRLQRERDALQQGGEGMLEASKLAHVKRDLRYVEGRIDHAVVVDPASQPRDVVAFGATVEVEDEDGARHSWRIVGENEADAGRGMVSWVSPLARALEGARVGEAVTWRRPAGDRELEVIAIRYP